MIVLSYILKILIVEVSHYYAVKSYSNTKGVKAYYSILTGFMSLYHKWDGKDRLKEINDEFSKNPNDHMVVSNMPHTGFGTVFVNLLSHEAIKDYLMKETAYTIKDLSNGILPMNLGFVTQSGQTALNNRAIFSDFFIYDRIQSLYDPMCTIINTHFNKFIKNKNIKNNEFTQINLHDFFCDITIDWTSLLLFGCESAEELNIDLSKYPEITKRTNLKKLFKDKKEENIIKVICLYSEMILEFFFDPILFLFGGWPYFFSTTEIYRDHKALTKFMNKIIIDFYQKRYNEYVQTGAKSKYVNIIDLIIEHNYNCIKNKNHKDILDNEQVIGSIIAFSFAGFDTSLQTSSSCIMWTAKNHQNWLDKIRNEGVDNLEKIKVNHSLELVMKETLRLQNPALMSFARR